ncbi:MAG: PTS mannitol transporter subunit IIABC [Deltaproteobacteria bacterium]|nr:PTS mannitol transporter subunit IIABC [Deltaproteobacteria bacterium]
MSDYLFVTGKLAADALMPTIKKMEPDFKYEVVVLNISVAALMDTLWIARHLSEARGCDRVMIPGGCPGDLSILEDRLGVSVIRGPKDLKDLPVFFGHERILEGYGEYRVKILAEIVDAYRMPWNEILAMAEYYRAQGADIIDLGCPPQGGFPGVKRVVAGLKEQGYTVSLDSFDPETILHADEAGMDLLLSVNSQNMTLASKLHCKVVVIPDFGKGLESLERNAAQVEQWGVPYVLDPILDPISFGFTESLHRFYETRRRHPNAEILMGLGNLTELTDADSIGINAVMVGIVTELGIDYVLSTEVISWARGAVTELDLARKLMYYAHKNRLLPKDIDDGLLTVKDPPHESYSEAELHHMHQLVSDKNFRIFTDDTWIYVFNHDIFIRGTDPQEIFTQLDVTEPSHAFYLGKELERAALSVQLGKKYTQEEQLRWGYLSDRRMPT